MSDDNVAEFVNVTQASPDVAQEYLLKSGGDLELAVSQFLTSNEEAMPAATSASSAASSSGTTPLQASRSGSGGSSNSTFHQVPRHRFSTFSDLAREQFAADGAPGSLGSGNGDDPAQFFTGGEKSGLAVTNPNDPANKNKNSSSGNLVDQIIRKAQQRGAPEADEEEGPEPEKPDFHGRGVRLGSDLSASTSNQVVAADSSDEEEENDSDTNQTVLRRTLYFWRDGFSIDDGPLYRFDDPRNEVYLRAINMGRAPVELLKVKPHQAVDVRIEQRPTDDYVKPRAQPSLSNSGPGQRLGSVPPSPAVSAPPSEARPTTQPTGASSSGLGTQGDATVQLRFADGSVQRLRFESAGPVQQLYDLVDAVGPATGGRNYVLQTPLPPKPLEDRTASLKSAGVVGAVVVQRWI